MELWDVLENRHSIRDFGPEPVSRELCERVVKAAALAPSAMNEQAWRIYACTGSTRAEVGEIVAQSTVHLAEYMDVLGPKRYEDAVHWYSSLGEAPVLMVFAVTDTDDPVLAANRQISLGAAIENLLLAATAEGLAACNITFAHWVRGELADLLEMTGDQRVEAIVALGWPGVIPAAAPPKRTDLVTWRD